MQKVWEKSHVSLHFFWLSKYRSPNEDALQKALFKNSHLPNKDTQKFETFIDFRRHFTLQIIAHNKLWFKKNLIHVKPKINDYKQDAPVLKIHNFRSIGSSNGENRKITICRTNDNSKTIKTFENSIIFMRIEELHHSHLFAWFLTIAVAPKNASKVRLAQECQRVTCMTRHMIL